MAEINPNVGDPAPAGAGGNQPLVSPENGQPIAGAPQSSQELLEIKKQLELTRKELQGLQSRQDKEQNETQRFMAEVKKQMANGKSLEEAEAAVLENRKVQEKDELLLRIARKIGALDDVSQPPAAGNGGNVTGDVAKVIAELQLDANSADVVSILGKGLDPLRQELELRRLVTRPRSQPSAAESSTIQAAPPAPAKEIDVAALTAEQSRLMKNPSKNYKRLAEIKEILSGA